MMTISADQVIKSSDNVTKYQYSALTRPHHLARPGQQPAGSPAPARVLISQFWCENDDFMVWPQNLGTLHKIYSNETKRCIR